MKQQVERRYATHEVRLAGDGAAPVIGGYAALFDAANSDADYRGWKESIDPGAFDSVMARKPDVRALWNHNPDHVLGRTASGTLRLSVDSKGLAYEVDPPDTQLARDLMVSMRRGDVNQSSYGFVVKRDQWTDEADGSVSRLILEYQDIFDVSPVSYPATDSTTSGVRSGLPSTMPAEMRSRFEKRAGSKGCECACGECAAGNCADCSADQCDDPECQCAKRSAAAPPVAVILAPEGELSELRTRLAGHIGRIANQ